MVHDGKKQLVREAVAVFDNVETLQEAIDDLQNSGFDRAELSLLAGEPAIKKNLGHLYTRIEELEDDPDVPTVAYIPSEAIGDAEGALFSTPIYIAAVTSAGIMAAVGGPLAAIITAAVAAGGAGAVLGGILASLIGKHHADYLQEQLDHGGLLLWVRTQNADREERAMAILSKHSARDVHIHGLSRMDG